MVHFCVFKDLFEVQNTWSFFAKVLRFVYNEREVDCESSWNPIASRLSVKNLNKTHLTVKKQKPKIVGTTKKKHIAFKHDKSA